MKHTTLLFLFCILSTYTFSQKNDNYAIVDNYVNSLGEMDSLNISSITKKLTSHFSDKKMKCRAIYYWIANNISMISIKNKTSRNSIEIEKIIQSRNSNSTDFASLFQEMCSLSEIRCLKIEGYTRFYSKEISDIPESINHTWNVVQLGKSPDSWFYVDVAKGCGYIDSRLHTFVKNFSSNYFFSEYLIFNLDHFPDNKSWILGESSLNLNSFFSLPIIDNEAYEINLQKFSPSTDFIHSAPNQPIQFEFLHSNQSLISSISIITGDGNKQSNPERINFTDANGKISFSYTFKKSASFPFKILINNNLFLIYHIEISE